MDAPQVLDREFLELRARILELAAAFDRLDRSDGDVAADPRLQRLIDGLAILTQDRSDRAEQVQLLFSRAYESDWQAAFGLEKVS